MRVVTAIGKKHRAMSSFKDGMDCRHPFTRFYLVLDDAIMFGFLFDVFLIINAIVIEFFTHQI